MKSSTLNNVQKNKWIFKRKIKFVIDKHTHTHTLLNSKEENYR